MAVVSRDLSLANVVEAMLDSVSKWYTAVSFCESVIALCASQAQMQIRSVDVDQGVGEGSIRFIII